MTPAKCNGYVEIFQVSLCEAKMHLAKPLLRAIRSGPPEQVHALSQR